VKDLDFDELDRAVNSLMAGVSKTPSPQDRPKEKTVEINSSSGISATQNTRPETNSTTVPFSRGDQNKVTPNVPATRRGGRFMDVVHSPSAMKKAEVPTRSVSRQAATIEPTKPITPTAPESKSDALPQSDTLSSSSMPTPTPISSIAPVKEMPVSSSFARNDWPDPLDVAGFGKEKSAEVKENKEEVAQKPEDVIPVNKQAAEISEPPLTSPFLADTKVDKRPLGGSATMSTNETSDVPLSSIPDITKEQLPATLEDTKSMLPEELHNDLMAIESDTTEPVRVTEKLEKEPRSTRVNEQPEVKEPVIEDKREPAKLEQQPTPVPSGPVSIPQQYKEEPSSLEPKSGAIYDTDTYHQPLAHPAKAKSGWMWVVWTILILLLGAGVGAALFFLGVV
jgi:hypothetical protein